MFLIGCLVNGGIDCGKGLWLRFLMGFKQAPFYSYADLLRQSRPTPCVPGMAVGV